MLNASLNFLLPPLTGAPVGTLEWPALGAVLAWLFILCLLGASAGLLHEYGRLPSSPKNDNASEPTKIHFGLTDKHLKAA
jgi:hypothetical protein